MFAPQQQLWRKTAWVGFITGVWVFLSLAVDLRLGINQAYFKQAYAGDAPALLHPTTYLDYAFITVLIPTVFLLRLLLGTLLLTLMQQALVPSEHHLAGQINHIGAIGMVATTLQIGAAYAYSLLYAGDAERHLFVISIKVGNLLYSLMFQAALAAILYSLYRTHLLPHAITFTATGLLLLAFGYSLIATHPDLTQFFSSLIAYAASMVLVGYLALAKFPSDPATTDTFYE